MSFKQKYLKYKSKYLSLKAQAKNNNLQNGGSNNNYKLFNGDDIIDLEKLSITP